MKLVIQIPCWNEQDTLADTIRSLPRRIPGVNTIEVVVVDDGSTDDTAAVAERAGADGVVRLGRHMGLAAAFNAGVKEALDRDADIMVNTDADLQYPSEHIARLIGPIISGRADISIGDRLGHDPRPFGPVKMLLERLGSAGARFFSGTGVRDAASGFRAFSRPVLEEMVLHGAFSHTLETLIFAGMRKFRLANVEIPINAPQRESRLFQSVPGYISRSALTILRGYLMYHPLRFFLGVGLLFFSAALVLGGRYLYFFSQGEGRGHVQSLILMAVLALTGIQSIILGMIGDVVAANRKLLEDLRLRMTRRVMASPHGEKANARETTILHHD